MNRPSPATLPASIESTLDDLQGDAGELEALDPIASLYAGWHAGLSRKTIKAYRSDLAHLARWALDDGALIPVDVDGEPDRVAALAWLLGRGPAAAHADAARWLSTMAAASTRARRRSTLRSFASFAVAAGVLPWSLELKARATSDRVHADPDARPSISPDLVAGLWECTAGDDLAHRRERAVLALLVYAGFRRFEICNLDVEHLDLPGARARVQRKHTGDRLAAVELPRPVVAALHAYVTTTGARTGPVFTSATGPTAGERLQPDAIGEILARLCDRCGAPRITPHALRHHGATLLATSGADAGEIQEWLGHTSSDAARSYIQAAGRRRRARAAADRIEALIPTPAIDGQRCLDEGLVEAEAGTAPRP